ncbi:MAG: tetratricopeptide repeat protein [Bacteroidota bacterium]
MKKIIYLLAFFTTLTLQAQINVDSLESSLPGLQEKDKIAVLNKLSKFYRNLYPERCIELGKQSLALSQKLGMKKEQAEATLYIGAGYTYLINPTEAMESFWKAIKLCEELDFKEGISFAYRYLGICYSYKGDNKNAYNYYMSAIDIGNKVGYYEGIANSYNNIAEMYWTQGDSKNNIDYLNKAIEYYNKAGMIEYVLNLNLKIGGIYKNDGNYDKAVEYYQKSFNLAKEKKSKYLTSVAYFSISSIYASWDDFTKAIEYGSKGLQLAKESSPKFVYAENLAGVGHFFAYSVKDFPKSLKIYEEALKIYKDLNYSYMVAKIQNEIGWVYLKMKDFKHALANEFTCLKVFENMQRDLEIASTLIIIGQMYHESGENKKALEYLNKGLLIQEKLGLKPGLQLCYLNLGKTYSALNQYVNAKKYFLKCLDVSKSLHTDEQISEVYSLLSDLLSKKGDWKGALYYSKLYSELKVEIYNDKRGKGLSDIKVKYELEKKDKEILIFKQTQELERAKEKNVQYILISGLILLLALAGFVFSRYQLKKKHSLLLEAKNKEMNETNSRLTESEENLKKLNLTKDNYLSIINKELSQAADYVLSLLPKTINNGTVHTEWLFKPSTQLGGDSLGYHWIDKDNFAFYLLDVCGHGVGSALHSVSVLNALRFQTLPNTDFTKPEQVLVALNNAFQMREHNGLYFTIWYGVYNLKTRRMNYSSAGHPPALLIKSYKECEFLRVPNFSVGGVKAFDYSSESLEVPVDANIFLFSDGVYEINPADNQSWDLTSLCEYLKNNFSGNNFKLNNIYSIVQELNKSVILDDDFSILRIVFPKCNTKKS